MIIISCEHAFNKVPAECKYLFEGEMAVLKTHEAYDLGAVELARVLAGQMQAPFFLSGITRLLIDANRSPGNPNLFSRFSKRLEKEQKNHLIENYYNSYRKPVEDMLNIAARRGQHILHISVHSFAPVLKGKQRNTDIGLLYDPQRKKEAALCRELKASILSRNKGFQVRFNYPYKGKSDGFTAYLRRNHPANAYIGIELEVNQKILKDPKRWRSLKAVLAKALSETVAAGK